MLPLLVRTQNKIIKESPQWTRCSSLHEDWCQYPWN